MPSTLREVWTEFLTDTASAFSLDGLKNSHPTEQEVNNPGEIGALLMRSATVRVVLFYVC